MEVKIRESGEIETLQWINKKTGENFIDDVIGSVGGFGSEDWQFERDRDAGIYHASQETFDWWEKVASDNMDVEEWMEELKEEHGPDAVYEAIKHVDTDLEYQAGALRKALEEEFGKRDSVK